MKCKIVVNTDSGNCDKLDVEAISDRFGCDTEVQFVDSTTDWTCDGFDTVVVCGGDGTLHHAIQKCKNAKLIYAPCGTLNETAHTERCITSLVTVNGKPFSYVCATGSFTEIGYSAQNSRKKRWKNLAYLPQIFKHYRCHDIAAQLTVDGKNYRGKYTLLMVLKSYRCFGFAFNKDYLNTRKPYLLAVKSVGKDSFINRVKMFFPLFRIFFCGAKPCEKDSWMLVPFDNLTISIDKPRDFCLDGEKKRLCGRLRFCEEILSSPIRVLSTPLVRRPTTT